MRPFIKTDRRSFLRLGALGAVGLSTSNCLRLLQADESRGSSADSVLFINLAGGPSHLDTLDMKPDGPSETRGEFNAISSSIAGLPVCEHLPNLAKVIDRFTLLRGISHTAGAHPQGQSYISTGNRPSPALIYPSLGSVAGKQLPSPPDVPSYVAIPATEWNAGFLGDAYAPFKTNAVPKPGQPFQVRGLALAEGMTIEKINRREDLLKKIDRRFREVETRSTVLEALDQFGQQAYGMITSARSREAFDVSKEPKSIQQQFTADDFNQSVLLACRLIEYGVRLITVTYAGWDTHTDNFKGHKRLMPPLDNALPAVIETLTAKGLLDRTLVVTMGEFGRTPKINVNTGRDHYPRVNWCLMAGGGVKPGQLIGGTDKGGAAPDDATEIKPDDLAATIYHSLGISPRTEYHTRSGRPVMIVPEGRVMTEVFA